MRFFVVGVGLVAVAAGEPNGEQLQIKCFNFISSHCDDLVNFDIFIHRYTLSQYKNMNKILTEVKTVYRYKQYENVMLIFL